MKVLLPKKVKPCNDSYIVSVDPVLAREWLKRNNFNRPRNDSSVAKYIRQIKQGRWQLTHQGIAFNRNGILLDGQHRLWAIVQSGQTVMMRVFVDQETEHYDVIDCGRNRSHLDVIRMSLKDASISTLHTTTLKCMLAGRDCRINNRWSSDELADLYVPYSGAVDFAVSRLRACRDRRVNDPTVRGVVARAWYYLPEESLELFCRHLQNLGNRSAPRLIRDLSSSLLRWEDRQERTRREIYYRTQLTLDAWQRGGNTLNIEPETPELYPIEYDER